VYCFGVVRLGVADGYLHPVLPRGLADADNLARREAHEKGPPPVDGGSLGYNQDKTMWCAAPVPG
jgi:hypothetical protein